MDHFRTKHTCMKKKKILEIQSERKFSKLSRLLIRLFTLFLCWHHGDNGNPSSLSVCRGDGNHGDKEIYKTAEIVESQWTVQVCALRLRGTRIFFVCLLLVWVDSARSWRPFQKSGERIAERGKRKVCYRPIWMVSKFWSIYMKSVLRVMIFHLRKFWTSSRTVYPLETNHLSHIFRNLM